MTYLYNMLGDENISSAFHSTYIREVTC